VSAYGKETKISDDTGTFITNMYTSIHTYIHIYSIGTPSAREVFVAIVWGLEEWPDVVLLITTYIGNDDIGDGELSKQGFSRT
jgi:hypothetical protein